MTEYVKIFNKAVLEIDEADDQVIMTTFQARLNNPDLVFPLGKTPPTLMMDLLFKAQKYMNGENTLTIKGLVGKRKKEENESRRARKGITKTISQTPKPTKVV